MDIAPEDTEENHRQLMVIVAEYDDFELDQIYERDPWGLLRFIGTCRRLGKAHAAHSSEERDLWQQTNELEARLGLPRRASHEIRRHFAA